MLLVGFYAFDVHIYLRITPHGRCWTRHLVYVVPDISIKVAASFIQVDGPREITC